jgi:hypothetical protein
MAKNYRFMNGDTAISSMSESSLDSSSKSILQMAEVVADSHESMVKQQTGNSGSV